MSTEEQRAYLLNTLRKAPEGSSRRLWAAAMLKHLDSKSVPAAKATPKGRQS